jgi:nucleoside-diphosphate-sugar epimerase
MMENKKTAFVTGASGFVGANLVRVLLRRDYSVHVLLRSSSKTWRIDEVLQKLTRHNGDLADGDSIRQIIEKIQPDVVFHLATYGAYPKDTDVERLLDINIAGTERLLLACRGVKDLSRFVYTGSSSEYGLRKEPMREDMLPEPNTLYGVTKASGTMLCEYFHRVHGIPTVVMRPFSVYGPWEEPGRLFPDIITALLKDKSPSLANPDAVRDYVYVEDFVDALIRAAEAPEAIGKIFNVAGGKETPVQKVFKTLAHVIGSKIAPHYGEVAPRSYDAVNWVGNTSKAKKVLGWSSTHSLKEGAAKTVSWFREHLGDYGFH